MADKPKTLEEWESTIAGFKGLYPGKYDLERMLRDWKASLNPPEGEKGRLQHMVAGLRRSIATGENPCARIFDHKYLDPDCVMNGCKGMTLRRLEARLSLLESIVCSIDDTLCEAEVLGLIRAWKKKKSAETRDAGSPI